jgi:hypothetical protein
MSQNSSPWVHLRVQAIHVHLDLLVRFPAFESENLPTTYLMDDTKRNQKHYILYRLETLQARLSYVDDRHDPTLF